VLLDGTTLSDHSPRVGAIARLARGSEPERTSKPANVTFPLGELVGKSVEEALWLFCADL
jgi:hypothetical protein